MPDPILDAHTSDPVAMGWMQGFPPAAAVRIQAEDAGHMRFPTHRYAFSAMREFLPSARVGRGEGPVWALPRAPRDEIAALRFTPLDGGPALTFADALSANFTDAIVVLHKGAIVYERYLGVTRADTPHIAFSVTKSFIGTLTEMLIAEGRLDPAAPVGSLIPELARSGFGDATLRQVLDMTTALDFSEDYTDARSGIGAFSMALGLTPRPAGYDGPRDVYAFLPTVAKAGTHGEAFTYRTCNTEVLGWIIARTEGKRVQQVLSERIWAPLGMEQDADFLLDSTGMAFAGGGLNPVLRDLARFGEAVRLGGKGVIQPAAIAAIQRGGDPAAFAKAGYALLPGWSYRSQWWCSHDDHGCFAGRGIHGQTLHIDPAAEMVVARFGSHPVAASSGNDSASLPLWRALGEHLRRG